MSEPFEGLHYPLPDHYEYDVPITVESSHPISRQFIVYNRRYDLRSRIAALLFYMTRNTKWIRTVYLNEGAAIEFEPMSAGTHVTAIYETSFD